MKTLLKNVFKVLGPKHPLYQKDVEWLAQLTVTLISVAHLVVVSTLAYVVARLA